MVYISLEYSEYVAAQSVYDISIRALDEIWEYEFALEKNLRFARFSPLGYVNKNGAARDCARDRNFCS